jgi:chorismate synthase
MIRMITAGESHGQYLSGIIEGLPAGVPVDIEFIEAELKRRRIGYGRSSRMATEQDRLTVTAGISNGKATGAPISILIENSDWKLKTEKEKPGSTDNSPIVIPRPGHADLTGSVKYGLDDLRDVSERASARETVVRTALGCFARLFLREIGIETASHTVSIGGVRIGQINAVSFESAAALRDDDPVRCMEPETAEKMKAEIDSAKAAGDTLGGSVELLIKGVPPGIGDCMIPENRLSARLAAAIFSIPSVKTFEIGGGAALTSSKGSEVTDAYYEKKDSRFRGDVQRKTNYAGGIEGGISTGEIIRCTAHFKPIPTLGNPLNSANLETGEDTKAPAPRADACIVPAAGVIMESIAAVTIADALTERFGSDRLDSIKKNIRFGETSKSYC